MKTMHVTASSKLSEVLDSAEEGRLLLVTPEGREFIIAEVDDDFDAEIEATRENRELMELLDERSRPQKTYTVEEAKKKLGLA
jgi:hypothetical protein